MNYKQEYSLKDKKKYYKNKHNNQRLENNKKIFRWFDKKNIDSLSIEMGTNFTAANDREYKEVSKLFKSKNYRNAKFKENYYLLRSKGLDHHQAYGQAYLNTYDSLKINKKY